MDNEFSQVSIQAPSIPDNFDSLAGSSKRDFALAIFSLLELARVRGINVAQPENFDLGTLQNRIVALEDGLTRSTLKQRTLPLNGVNGDVITVAFDDMGTVSYWVNVIFITPNANINTVTWSLIDGSKTTSGCQIRIDGDASTYKLEVQILEAKQ